MSLSESSLDCPLCLGPFSFPIKLPCCRSHVCQCCLERSLEACSATCPLCRKRIIGFARKGFEVDTEFWEQVSDAVNAGTTVGTPGDTAGGHRFSDGGATSHRGAISRIEAPPGELLRAWEQQKAKVLEQRKEDAKAAEWATLEFLAREEEFLAVMSPRENRENYDPSHKLNIAKVLADVEAEKMARVSAIRAQEAQDLAIALLLAQSTNGSVRPSVESSLSELSAPPGTDLSSISCPLASSVSTNHHVTVPSSTLRSSQSASSTSLDTAGEGSASWSLAPISLSSTGSTFRPLSSGLNGGAFPLTSWACRSCTLLNPRLWLRCSACGTPKVGSSGEGASHSSQPSLMSGSGSNNRVAGANLMRSSAVEPRVLTGRQLGDPDDGSNREPKKICTTKKGSNVVQSVSNSRGSFVKSNTPLHQTCVPSSSACSDTKSSWIGGTASSFHTLNLPSPDSLLQR